MLQHESVVSNIKLKFESEDFHEINELDTVLTHYSRNEFVISYSNLIKTQSSHSIIPIAREKWPRNDYFENEITERYNLIKTRSTLTISA